MQQPSKLTRTGALPAARSKHGNENVKKNLAALAVLLALSTCTAVEPSYAKECTTAADVANASGLKNTFTFSHPGTDVAVEIFQSDRDGFAAFLVVTDKGCVVGSADKVPTSKVVELASKTGLTITAH